MIDMPRIRRVTPRYAMRPVAVLAAAVLGLSAGEAAQGPSAGKAPFVPYQFQVNIDGLPGAAFTSVAGLRIEVEAIEYRAGPDGSIIRKVPGLTRYSNIVLKQPVPASDTLHAWLLDSTEGTPQRRQGSIGVFNAAGVEVIRYNFAEAFICGWELGPMDAQSKDKPLEETITICVERLNRVVP